MPTIKLFNLLALSSLAILACSFTATPASALSADNHDLAARHVARGHEAIAKRKRSSAKRCKPRASSIVPDSATVHTSTTTSVKHSSTPATHSSAPPPPPPPAASPNPPPPKLATGGSKFGISWGNPNSISLAPFAAPGRIVYTWSYDKPSQADSLGLNFCPMLARASDAAAFQKVAVAGYANCALGFNEPELSSQANMDFNEGVQYWKQYIQPLSEKGYTLVSPAVTSDPAGKVWMSNFLGACSGCQIDAIALHWYGTDSNQFIAFLQDFHTTFGKPIWVTEYACESFTGGPQCSQDQVYSFTSAVKSFMDSNSWVEHYAPFGLFEPQGGSLPGGVSAVNALMTSSGQPSNLAYMYL